MIRNTRPAAGQRIVRCVGFAMSLALASCSGSGVAPRDEQPPSPEARLAQAEREFAQARRGNAVPASDLRMIDQRARVRERMLLRAARESARQDREFEALLEQAPEGVETDASARVRRDWAEEYRPASAARAEAVDHYLYGRALQLAGAASEAKYQIEQALSLDEGFAPARALLGMWYFRHEQWAEARSELEHARRLDDSDDRVWILLAYTYEKLDKLEDARLLMVAALDARRCVVEAARWLFEYHLPRNEYGELIVRLEAAVECRPEDSELHVMLGNVYASLGRNADAVDQLRIALEGLPGGWGYTLRLADLLRRAERYAEAEKEFERILAEAPPDFFARMPQGRASIEELLDQTREEQAAGRRLYFSLEEDVSVLRGSTDDDARLAASERLAPRIPALGKKAFADIVPLLIRGPDPRLQVLGIQTLMSYAPRESFGVMKSMAEEIELDPSVRVHACMALARYRTAESAEVLLGCLQAQEPEIFHAARVALRVVTRMSPVVIGGGEELNDDPEGRARVCAEWKAKVAEWPPMSAGAAPDGR